MAWNKGTTPTEDQRKIALIRSLVAYADGRETSILDDIADVLHGADVAELVMLRAVR